MIQAKNWTLDRLKSTPDRRFMKTHANLSDLPAGAAKGVKEGSPGRKSMFSLRKPLTTR